jgi:hypothetical protein
LGIPFWKEVSFRTTELGTNEFKNDMRYNKRDLINGKNIAAKKMGDNNNPMTLYEGKIY